jgi:small-conductance mechanosensitive channel
MKGLMNMVGLVAMAGFIMSVGLSSGFAGETKWQKNHPRRTEVNKRLSNQNKRINQGVKNGTLTKAQAAQLHKEDRQIRQEERAMASQNGGHITKQEQRTLNQQENKVSRQIYNEKHGQ